MRSLEEDDGAVTAVLATIMLVAVGMVMSAATFMLVRDFEDHVGGTPPSVALVTDQTYSGQDRWQMRIAMALPARGLEHYIFIVRTPENGTLVAIPDHSTFNGERDFHFQLGATAGPGTHADNETIVGADGLGGFRVALVDIDGDTFLGGGDRIAVYYDGDGDQRHTLGADDPLPRGIYGFEIKERILDRYVALEERAF